MFIFLYRLSGLSTLLLRSFANLVDTKMFKNEDRGLSINLLYMNGGIVLSTIFQILSDNTFLSGKSACAADASSQCGMNATNVTFF